MDLAHRPRRVPPPVPPRKPSHLSKPRAPTEVPPLQTHQGHRNTCSCSNPGDSFGRTACKYYGHCLEPLAWTIEKQPIKTQTTSPLFAVLPRELRDQVFEYAMIDNKVESFEALFRRSGTMRFPAGTMLHDIALNLLLTCRAAYLEAWYLPLTLNPYVIYDFQQGYKINKIFAWQLALLQSLDITTQQANLENGILREFLLNGQQWRATERSQGAYFAPQIYQDTQSEPKVFSSPLSFEHTIIPFPSTTTTTNEPRHFLSHILGETLLLPNTEIPWSSAMRVACARPLLHLTLRIGAKQWWTWTDHPNPQHNTLQNSDPEVQQLALDPIIGNGSHHPSHRPLPTRMKALAQRRRVGDHPVIPENCGWAHTIAKLSHLQTLEFVLESFEVKRRQLDDVVECAKTWIFPIEGVEGEEELGWDGEVGMSGWSVRSGGGDGDGRERRGGKWWDNESRFDVRRVRFVRRKVVDG